VHLSGATLVQINVGGANLTGVNFTFTDMTLANLVGAELTSVNWFGTTCPNGAVQFSYQWSASTSSSNAFDEL
jgi:uncharacterized protein YjbI with pentapeptide repeats